MNPLHAAARHGPYVLLAGLIAGLLLPGLAQPMRPLLPPMVVLLLFVTVLRMEPDSILGSLADLRRVLLAVVGLQLALPLALLAVGTAGGVVRQPGSVRAADHDGSTVNCRQPEPVPDDGAFPGVCVALAGCRHRIVAADDGTRLLVCVRVWWVRCRIVGRGKAPGYDPLVDARGDRLAYDVSGAVRRRVQSRALKASQMSRWRSLSSA